MQGTPLGKEVAIRRRIGEIYTKREEDFPAVKDYNDYLEEVEDIIFNLSEGINVAATEAKIKLYKEQNAEQIVQSQAKKAEKRQQAARAAQAGNAGPASTTDKQESADGAMSGQPGATYLPSAPASMLSRPLAAQPTPIGARNGSYSLSGEDEPEDDDSRRLKEERAAKAGGWTIDIPRKRALEELLGSLWVN
eukprot:SM000143S00764  [mRNA]  locus=s143:202071:203591:- [translate_table: standard]